MDSPTRYRPPHQPQISSFEHQHVEGHRSHYAQAGHRQVRFRQHSQDQPAPHPDLSMANHDRVGHGFHRQFQALSLRETSNVPPRECFLPRDINQRLCEGFLFLDPKSLKRNPGKALSTAEEVLAQGTNLSKRYTMRAYLLKVRALFELGRFGECLGEFETLEVNKIELNEGLLAAKGRTLQAMSRFTEARTIFENLYFHSNSVRDGLALGRLYQVMGKHQEALDIFKRLRTVRSRHEDIPCDDKGIELAVGGVYQKMGEYEEALKPLKKLRASRSGREDILCDDKGIELAFGRLHQEKGEHDEALRIFKHLRAVRSGHEDIPCDDKDIELAVGGLYQKTKKYKEALDIFKTLRASCSGHKGIPCDDKDIELAVGRLHEEKEEHNEALTTFEGLRTVYYARHKDTAFKDKDIELTLARQYQKMKKYEEALATFEGLRTFYCARHRDTAFKDKNIELALGRLHQEKGEYDEALTTFKELRTVYYARQKDTAFKDKDIELALGHIFTDLMSWHQFDQMQLDQKGFAGPEVDLSISIRYFYECISTCQDKEISGLLGKAIKHACNAIEKSHYLDASSFSQLAHCLRLVASLPAEKVPNTAKEGEVPLKEIYTQLFDEATRLDPGRSNRLKNESWRNKEDKYLKRLGVTSTSEEACVRMEEEHRT